MLLCHTGFSFSFLYVGGRGSARGNLAQRAQRAVSFAEEDPILSVTYKDLIDTWRNEDMSLDRAAATLKRGRAVSCDAWPFPSSRLVFFSECVAEGFPF